MKLSGSLLMYSEDKCSPLSLVGDFFVDCPDNFVRTAPWTAEVFPDCPHLWGDSAYRTSSIK